MFPREFPPTSRLGNTLTPHCFANIVFTTLTVTTACVRESKLFLKHSSSAQIDEEKMFKSPLSCCRRAAAGGNKSSQNISQQKILQMDSAQWSAPACGLANSFYLKHPAAIKNTYRPVLKQYKYIFDTAWKQSKEQSQHRCNMRDRFFSLH